MLRRAVLLAQDFIADVSTEPADAIEEPEESGERCVPASAKAPLPLPANWASFVVPAMHRPGERIVVNACANVRTGAMRRSIRHRTRRVGTRVRLRVSANTYYSRWGPRRHRPTSSGLAGPGLVVLLAFSVGSGVLRQKVNHPATRATALWDAVTEEISKGVQRWRPLHPECLASCRVMQPGGIETILADGDSPEDARPGLGAQEEAAAQQELDRNPLTVKTKVDIDVTAAIADAQGLDWTISVTVRC